MKELIAYIAKSIVSSPDDVQVQEIEGEKMTIVELRVAPDDMGKVIGKQGKTARAIRSILSASAARHKKKAVLEILE